MKYIRTKDGITTSDKATHELIEDICDAGYFKTLKKGAYVCIDKEWLNFYGKWVDIIDENGRHYSIRPNEVERVTKELSQADTIEELCDKFVIHNKVDIWIRTSWNSTKETVSCYKRVLTDFIKEVYGAIWTDKGLIYVAKMNDKGELELL